MNFVAHFISLHALPNMGFEQLLMDMSWVLSLLSFRIICSLALLFIWLSKRSSLAKCDCTRLTYTIHRLAHYHCKTPVPRVQQLRLFYRLSRPHHEMPPLTLIMGDKPLSQDRKEGQNIILTVLSYHLFVSKIKEIIQAYPFKYTMMLQFT